MIKMNEIRVGDILETDFEGQRSEGAVAELNHEDKEVCVQIGDQSLWFPVNDLSPVPLDEAQLGKFHFEKQVNDDKSVKYLRGPFRILLPENGQFGHFEIWYREDRRQISHPIGVHELQNHYHQMTKVDLTRD